MDFFDSITTIFRTFKGLFRKGVTDIQPRDILVRLLAEMEKRKKYGIEERAFVPNVYILYLSPLDYEEMSPLISGIKDQLRNKIMETVKKKGYKLLSSSVSIEIREDTSALKNQVLVESSFLKEKTPPPSVKTDLFASFHKGVHKPETVHGAAPGEGSSGVENGEAPCPGIEKALPAIPQPPSSPWAGNEMKTRVEEKTRIVEDRKTKFKETLIVSLEFVQGEERGGTIQLREGEYTFGRGKEAQILLRDSEETVSRAHFKMIVREGHIRIKDLESRNGTKVNGIPIVESELRKGDTIEAGPVLLKVA